MTDELEQTLRWADECVPMLEQLAVEQCSAHLRQAADVMRRLIRLAHAQPQGEPVAWRYRVQVNCGQGQWATTDWKFSESNPGWLPDIAENPEPLCLCGPPPAQAVKKEDQ